jgi:Leucine-rich repeat (LRR) protein
MPATGLEYCTNLEELDLDYNQISDISALSKLTNLEKLELEDNKVNYPHLKSVGL